MDNIPKAPMALIREAIRAVPAVRYALGLLGILAVVSIAGYLVADTRVALLGTAVTVGLMPILLVFAIATRLVPKALARVAVLFVWACMIFFLAAASLTLTSVFFRKPLDLSNWLTGTPPTNSLPPSSKLHLTEVEIKELVRTAREGTPPQRKHALTTLCSMNWPEAAALVADRSSNDPDAGVRDTAAALIPTCSSDSWSR